MTIKIGDKFVVSKELNPVWAGEGTAKYLPGLPSHGHGAYVTLTMTSGNRKGQEGGFEVSKLIPVLPIAFKKGDKVKILRKTSSYLAGWNNSWSAYMDGTVGKIGVVSGNDNDSSRGVPVFILGTGTWSYPASVLELVELVPEFPGTKYVVEFHTPYDEKWTRSANYGADGKALSKIEFDTYAEAAEAAAHQQKRMGTYTYRAVAIPKPAPIAHTLLNGAYQVGDHVKVTYGYGWNGEGIIQTFHKGTDAIVSVKMTTGNKTGSTGGFYPKDLKFISRETGVGGKLKQEGTKAIQGHSVVFKIAKDAAVLMGKQIRYVNIEHVQLALKEKGYKPSDLGNAAGGIFRGKNWKDTGKTINSSRATSRARKVTVWEYVGSL